MKVRIYPKCIKKCSIVDEMLNIHQANRRMKEQLSYSEQCLSDIQSLVQQGNLIAMRKTNDAVFPYEVIGFFGASVNDIYFRQLGCGMSGFYDLGHMSLSPLGDGVVVLDDWHVNIQNNGLGTYFLSSVIKYLGRQGYRKIIGKICPCDFDHEPMLRHIYTKLGFTITDCETYRHICCYLTSYSKEKETSKDIVQWLQVLDELSDNGRIAETLKISPDEFHRVSMNLLFQKELICAIQKILKCHNYYSGQGLSFDPQNT